MWVFDSHEMPERWHLWEQRQREESTSDLPKKPQWAAGWLSPHRNQRRCAGGQVVAPAGPGIKGKQSELPLPVMFPGQSLHQHSSWHRFPASVTCSPWETGQKFWTWARLWFLLFEKVQRKRCPSLPTPTPPHVVKAPFFLQGSPRPEPGVKLQPKLRTSGHKANLKQLPFSSLGFPGGSDGKESTCNAGDLGLIPGWERSPGEGDGHPLKYSCLEIFMDRGAWRATVHGVQRVRHTSDTSEWLTLSAF